MKRYFYKKRSDKILRRSIFAGMIVCSFLFFSFCVSPPSILPSFKDLNEAVKQIKLPDGFKIEIYIDQIENARSMCSGPDSILFVGSRSAGNVYAVIIKSETERSLIKIAENLNSPNGVAYKNGNLYVAEIDRILKFENIAENLTNPQYQVISDAYPSDQHHGWKFIAFGPDDHLYIPVGAPCNVCNPDNPIYSTITRLDIDGGKPEIFASGIRNTVGFDWHPETKELWFTDNGRDWMGDNKPPDELNHAPRAGMHFGFPFCHGKNIQEPDFPRRDCSEFTPPVLELGPHVAALGMRFYTGKMFPSKYHNGIFIAEHGSWNRSTPIGYRVMFVRMENNEPATYQVFAEGWLQGNVAFGRPVDVLVMPDGALLVSDDKGDAIYRISYSEKSENGENM